MASLRTLLAAVLLAAPVIAAPSNKPRDETTVVHEDATIIKYDSSTSTTKPTSIAKPPNKVQQIFQEPVDTVITTITESPSMTAFASFNTILPIEQWADPEVRNWTVTLACRTDGCTARRYVDATAFDLDMPMPTFADATARIVCQNSETVYPRITPPPELPDNGVWQSELHFSKTEDPRYCAGYGKLNRCMARYTSSWKQTTSSTSNDTWIATVFDKYQGHKDAKIMFATSSTSVVTSTITHAGPHWGIATPKVFYAKKKNETERSCDSESSCMEHCRHSHKKSLKVLWILLGVLGGLALLGLLGYLLKKYLSRRRSYEVEEVRTNRPRGVRETTEPRTVA